MSGMELIGNKAVTELTARMITKGREPHSIVICGENGLGKKTLARYIAAQLLCEEMNGTPCGKCRSCRLIERGVHPDVMTAVSSETGNYKADDIRAIVSDAYISPNESRLKVYIIPDIDRSVQTSEQIQNILLKTIEEPPDPSVLILTARSREIFLDTIISRTIQLMAEEVSPAEAMGYLISKGTDRAAAEEAVRRCGGNIGRALKYAEDEEERRIAGLAADCCKALAEGNEYQMLISVSGCDGKKAAFTALMGYMQRIVRDAVRLREGAGDSFVFSREICRQLGTRFSSIKLAGIYDVLSDHSRRAAANCIVSTLQISLTASLMSF